MQGIVSVDGALANTGHVTFIPVRSGMGRGGMGAINPDGSYHLRNVPLGEVTFTIVPEKNTGRQVATSLPTGDTVIADEVLPMIAGPKSYGRGQVTMRMEVMASFDRYDFALRSGDADGAKTP